MANAEYDPRLHSLFTRLDVDHDGYIGINELANLMYGKTEDHMSRAREVLAKSDLDHDDKISFKEFVDFIKDQETQLKKAFKQLDINKDNKIDAHEVQMAMKKLGIELALPIAAELLKKMDVDNSGDVDFAEFRNFLMFSGQTDMYSIYHFWRKSSSFDIGDQLSIPDDFSSSEKASGVAAKTLLCGGIAGAVSRTTTAPLDRLKVLLQAGGSKATGSSSLLGSFKNMIKEGGYSGLWRGNGVNVMKIAPETAVKFLAYEKYKSIIMGGQSRDCTLMEKFVAGALSGATAQTVIYPMELLKTRMSLRKSGEFSSIFDCAKKSYKEGGISVFYRGYVPNLIGILPYAGIDLALFETFKRKYSDYKKSIGEPQATPPVYVSLTAGACSSVCGQIVTYPLALVRTKLQASRKSTSISMNHVCQKILKENGPKGFYQGILPNFLKVIPAVSISYATFDYMKSVMKMK